MFLIVEGIHDTGKSTLVNNICDTIPVIKPYIGKRLFPELVNAKLANVSEFALGTNCAVVWFAKYYSTEISVVFDRLHFSEYAYSIVKRNVNVDFAKERFRIIDEQLAEAKIKVIYLQCSYEAMLERAKKKNQVYSVNDYYDLQDRFIEACKMTKIEVEIIDTDVNDKDIVLSKAISFIKED